MTSQPDYTHHLVSTAEARAVHDALEAARAERTRQGLTDEADAEAEAPDLVSEVFSGPVIGMVDSPSDDPTRRHVNRETANFAQWVERNPQAVAVIRTILTRLRLRPHDEHELGREAIRLAYRSDDLLDEIERASGRTMRDDEYPAWVQYPHYQLAATAIGSPWRIDPVAAARLIEADPQEQT